jgi:hypothetical protein
MSGVLDLRAGEEVEVRTEAEILSTLARDGTLDGLPFMPEMLEYCGRRFRVFKRADKTCDTTKDYKSRRMQNAVHLEALRCRGDAHGGCQAGCLLFWKEAWLRRPVAADPGASTTVSIHAGREGLTREGLQRATLRPQTEPGQGALYVCQATELPRATTPLHWWDPLQYAREVRSGNVLVRSMVRAFLIAWYNVLARRLARLGVRQYPHVAGQGTRTPTAKLGLQPGERVRVKQRQAILATLDEGHRNRGLWFDVEMVPFCGQEFRVLRRVERIIDERSGKMVRLPNDCIILDGAYCRGHLSRDRLFCPRSIYAYWREIWLERVDEPSLGSATAPDGPGRTAS